jgi:zeta-carotene desaturase
MRRVSRALQDYYREGEGSLMQCVLTPADAYMPLTNEAIAAKVDKQVGLVGLLVC